MDITSILNDFIQALNNEAVFYAVVFITIIAWTYFVLSFFNRSGERKIQKGLIEKATIAEEMKKRNKRNHKENSIEAEIYIEVSEDMKAQICPVCGDGRGEIYRLNKEGVVLKATGQEFDPLHYYDWVICNACGGKGYILIPSKED